jgi:hypothetical protein
MKRRSIWVEFGHFILHEKKWWMIPLFVLIGILALFALLAESPVAPFLYPLF